MPSRRDLLIYLVICAALLLLYTARRSQDPSIGKKPDNAGYKRTVVAIGDLHSYLPNALKVLQMADVVDGQGNWTGRVDYLVQTGDMADRGADTIQLYGLFENLRAQAATAGGQVVSHLGNHEFMNLIGDWRYVYRSELDTFGSVEARQKAFSSTGIIGSAFRANYSTASRVPLHPDAGEDPYDDFKEGSIAKTDLWNAALAFCHGGLHPQLSSLTPFPSNINDVGRSLMLKLDRRKPFPPPHPPAAYPGLPKTANKEEVELYGVMGPLWFRGWAEEPETKQFCDVADAVMKRIGVRRLIMGHTPNFKHIVSKCRGTVIIIDTGITPAYGGILSALKIEYSLVPVKPVDTLAIGRQHVLQVGLRNSTRRWKEVEIVTAIYEGRTETLVKLEREIGVKA